MRYTARMRGGRTITELAKTELKLAAAEAFFEKYEIPPASNAAMEAIMAEWHAPQKKKAKRKRAA